MRSRRTLSIGAWLLCLTLTALSPWSGAAAAAAEPDPDTAPVAEGEAAGSGRDGQDAASPTRAGETGDAEETGEGTEVFVPSEEISEDFAVSFPVDI